MLDEKDFLGLVNELNLDYYEISGDDEFCPFVFESCGYTWGITFMDELVWNSEEDFAEDEDGNEKSVISVKCIILNRALSIAFGAEKNIRKLWNKAEEEGWHELCFPKDLPKPNPLDVAAREGVFEE